MDAAFTVVHKKILYELGKKHMTLKLGNLGEFHKDIVYRDVSRV